ncbi:predicted protein [Aspergillus terreus NIH2624]|uniref:Uncharacterized protein n=1 Tax=Aspergillus terreus (strain NIH 2624 / FGSC A1156) TaxID=341663 RepID=Q0C8P8_ASPTN|nr:uncharacterized protein ATEG_09936 [Aspergillus terreus NIH2624]EAU30127.1 predicted protein [Aspergillus terreus NIH2624]
MVDGRKRRYLQADCPPVRKFYLPTRRTHQQRIQLLVMHVPEGLKDEGPGSIEEGDKPSNDDASFTAIIQRLSLENEKLKSEIGRLQRHAHTITHTYTHWAAQYRTLEQETAQQERSIASLQERLRVARDDISQAIRVLQRHQSTRPHYKTSGGTGAGTAPFC